MTAAGRASLTESEEREKKSSEEVKRKGLVQKGDIGITNVLSAYYPLSARSDIPGNTRHEAGYAQLFPAAQLSPNPPSFSYHEQTLCFYHHVSPRRRLVIQFPTNHQ